MSDAILSGTKVCCKCGTEKPTSEFYRDRACSDGLKSRCRNCYGNGLRKPTAEKSQAAFRVGDVIGALTVIGIVDTRKGHRFLLRCVCGKEVSITQSHLLKRRSACGNQCSRPIGWGSGRTRSKDGYIVVIINRRYFFEHRLIMEKFLGRPLLATEEVHHINGVKDDNRPENLEVLDKSKHSLKHKDVLLELRRLRRDNKELRKKLNEIGEPRLFATHG